MCVHNVEAASNIIAEPYHSDTASDGDTSEERADPNAKECAHSRGQLIEVPVFGARLNV